MTTQTLDLASATHGYRRLLARRAWLLGLLGTALVCAILVDLASGPSGMGLLALLDGILHPSHLSVTDSSSSLKVISIPSVSDNIPITSPHSRSPSVSRRWIVTQR